MSEDEEFEEELAKIITAVGNIPLDRLEVICTAERDGRCVVLPCKVGANAISESIFSGKRAIVPMANVHHIEKRDGGILLVMNGTRWSFEYDTWDGGVWIGDTDNQAQDFLKSWCCYRHELEGINVL